MITGALSLAACAPLPAPDPNPHFALTSAHVIAPSDRPYPVNLVFVAAVDDPIWANLTGIGLPGDLDRGPSEFDLIEGEGSDGDRLGNVTFDLDVPPEGLSFNTVDLILDGRPEPVTVDVGTWDLSTAAPEEFTAGKDAEVVAMSSCSTADFPLASVAESIDAFDTGSPEVVVDRAVLAPSGDAVTVSFSCTDTVDFFVMSPTVEFTARDGVAHTARLTPVSIGFQDIDETDFQRISAR